MFFGQNLGRFKVNALNAVNIKSDFFACFRRFTVNNDAVGNSAVSQKKFTPLGFRIDDLFLSKTIE